MRYEIVYIYQTLDSNVMHYETEEQMWSMIEKQ